MRPSSRLASVTKIGPWTATTTTGTGKTDTQAAEGCSAEHSPLRGRATISGGEWDAKSSGQSVPSGVRGLVPYEFRCLASKTANLT